MGMWQRKEAEANSGDPGGGEHMGGREGVRLVQIEGKEAIRFIGT